MSGDTFASKPSNPSEQSKGAASALQPCTSDLAAAVPQSAASAVGPAYQPLSLASKKHEVSAYTADCFASSSGQEVSFEEVRAANWLARQAFRQQVNILQHDCKDRALSQLQ